MKTKAERIMPWVSHITAVFALSMLLSRGLFEQVSYTIEGGRLKKFEVSRRTIRGLIDGIWNSTYVWRDIRIETNRSATVSDSPGSQVSTGDNSPNIRIGVMPEAEVGK